MCRKYGQEEESSCHTLGQCPGLAWLSTEYWSSSLHGWSRQILVWPQSNTFWPSRWHGSFEGP
jgi:hypothetical protein